MSNLVPFSPIHRRLPWRGIAEGFFDDLFPAAPDDIFSLVPFEEIGLFRPWELDPFSQAFPGDNLAIDLYEVKDKYILKASLPGIREKDIEVSEQNGLLNIRATCEAEVKQKEAGWQVFAQRRGAWQRTLRLPADVDIRRAKATLQDGVLTLSLPKRAAEDSLIHRIKVSMPKIKMPSIKKGEKRIKIAHN